MAKVQVQKSNFTGISHGLKFVDGVSEDFTNQELLGRLKRKGYVEVEEKGPSEKERLIAKCVELGIDITDLGTNAKLKEAIKAAEGGGGGA